MWKLIGATELTSTAWFSLVFLSNTVRPFLTVWVLRSDFTFFFLRSQFSVADPASGMSYNRVSWLLIYCEFPWQYFDCISIWHQALKKKRRRFPRKLKLLWLAKRRSSRRREKSPRLKCMSGMCSRSNLQRAKSM